MRRGGPVSYTHLDVYKRQVFNCLGALLTASALFGPGPAAAIRVCNNVLGSLFGLFFALVWPWLLDALSRRRTAAARES